MFLLLLGIAHILPGLLSAQDEAYTNEIRSEIMERGQFVYSLGYGTDFKDANRIFYQHGYSAADNFSVGTNFIYSSEENTNGNFGIGIFLRNHFTYRQIRPFIEPQANVRFKVYGDNDFLDSDVDIYIELSALGGVSIVSGALGRTFTLDFFVQYFSPFGTTIPQQEGFIPAIRLAGFLR